MSDSDARRAIPSVGALLERDEIRLLIASHGRALVVEAVRRAADDVRRNPDVDDLSWIALVEANLRTIERRSLRPVINATGVILHTNLGRAPLADAAVDAIREIAHGYTNLEYDLGAGNRGSRYVHCVELLRELTGAEDAIVVNNCAAALVLALSALARDREVIVSRGELVEIGGSFRVPDIMARSGAHLVEVGTTNRTHLGDYARAITSRTGAIAKVHRSNFAQAGFVSDVAVVDLAPVAAEHGIPIVHDLGSGLMIDLAEFGLTGEPTASAAIENGATVVLMSGDKLLGGPQAGIILGSRESVSRMRNDPFARALRIDKMTIAALAATLELYRDRDRALREIPTLAMISAAPAQIRARCETAAARWTHNSIEATVVESQASVGAGAFPVFGIPSFSVRLAGAPDDLQQRLRSARTPVVGRIADGFLHLDLRSVPERFDQELIDTVAAALS
jgi:L-seryl-tRNA(Ser) seleniumtransferase